MADFKVENGIYKRGDGREREEEKPKKKDVGKEISHAFDELGQGFAKLFQSKDKAWAKKGEGHTLAAAAAADAAKVNQKQNTSAPSAASGGRTVVGAERTTAAAAKASARSTAARPTAQQQAGGNTAVAQPIASEAALVEMGFQPSAAAKALKLAAGDLEKAVEILSTGQLDDAGVARASTAMPSSSTAPSDAPPPSPPPPPPPRPPPPPPYSEEVLEGSISKVMEEDHRLGEQRGLDAYQLLLKLITNVISDPANPKYRRVRISNPKIAAALHSAAAIRLLQLVGFVLVDGETAELADEIASDGARLTYTSQALERALALAMSAPPFLGPRDVQVFSASGKPASSPVSDQFYELTAAELKEIAASSRLKRDHELTLRTRAQREAATVKRVHSTATVRVRFPDGVQLQAVFSAAAPVSLLLEWVSAALRQPGQPFELLMLRGKPLTDLTLSLEQADLVPSALLNFRTPATECFQSPWLADTYMSQAQPLPLES